MTYPPPSHAITVWFTDGVYHVCTPPGEGQAKGTHETTRDPAEIAEIARSISGRAKPERRLIKADGQLADVTAFDMLRWKPVYTEKELQEIARKAINSGAVIKRHVSDRYLSHADREKAREQEMKNAEARKLRDAKRAAKVEKDTNLINLLTELGL